MKLVTSKHSAWRALYLYLGKQGTDSYRTCIGLGFDPGVGARGPEAFLAITGRRTLRVRLPHIRYSVPSGRLYRVRAMRAVHSWAYQRQQSLLCRLDGRRGYYRQREREARNA